MSEFKKKINIQTTILLYYFVLYKILMKKITLILVLGVFNVPTNAAGTMILLDEWSSSSNLVDIEVVAGYELS
jgi:hypothetical protein